jgi:predicted metal-binding membrane protein
LIAWVFVLQQTAMNSSMMGVPALPAFLWFWVVMMIAMMFPSVAPMAIVWSNGIVRTATGTERAVRLTAFAGGYLAAWTLYGLLAFVAIAAIPQTRLVTAALFAFAGLYQLTPLKHACLRHCRAPFVALMHYAAWPPRARDFRVGLHHGVYCVGCCWGLMAILIAVGVMNLYAMLGVAVIIFLEKIWRRGRMLANALGVAFVAAAALVLFGVMPR